MEFYLIYIFYIALLLLLNFYLKGKRNGLEIFALISITLVTGLRNYTGYDYATYVYIYESGIFDAGYEPGFVLLMNILRAFGLSFYYMFFIFGLATYIFLYLGIKKYTKHSGIALMIFMLIPGLYLNTLTIIRQELAVTICFYAFFFLKEKKYKKYILLMLLASSFHYSSLVISIFHLVVWKYASRATAKQYLIAIIVSLIIAKVDLVNFLTLVLGGGKYAVYIEGDPVVFEKLLILNLLLVFFIFYYDRIVSRNDTNKYIFAFSILAIIFINCFSSLLIITRLGYYLRIFEIILVAEFIYVFRYKLRPLILCGIFSLYLAIFIASLNNDMEAEDHGQPKIIPYKSVFDE